MSHSHVALCVALVWAVPARADKVAVLPTQFDESSKGQVPKLFDDYILTAVQNLGSLEVVGQEDISAILGFEKQKDVFNCDDTSCIADIGGALGVDKIMVVKIAKLGTDWIATAKLINIKLTKVEARINEIVKGDTKALLQAVPRIVGRLFDQAPPPVPEPKEGESGAPSDEKPTPTSRPSTPGPTTYDSSFGSTQRTAGVALLVVGAVLAAVGGVLLGFVMPEGTSTSSFGGVDYSDNYGCYSSSSCSYGICCSYDAGYSADLAYAENGCSSYTDSDYDGVGCDGASGYDVVDETLQLYGYIGSTFLLVVGLALEGVGAVLRASGGAKAELATDSASATSVMNWIGWIAAAATLAAPIYGMAADDAEGATIWGFSAGAAATLSFFIGAFTGSAHYAAATPVPTVMYARMANGRVLPTYGFGLTF